MGLTLLELERLLTVQGMQALQLVVHGNQLVTNVLAVLDASQGEQHRLNLALAIDQHAALRGSGLVGQCSTLNTPIAAEQGRR